MISNLSRIPHLMSNLGKIHPLHIDISVADLMLKQFNAANVLEFEKTFSLHRSVDICAGFKMTEM